MQRNGLCLKFPSKNYSCKNAVIAIMEMTFHGIKI